MLKNELNEIATLKIVNRYEVNHHDKANHRILRIEFSKRRTEG